MGAGRKLRTLRREERWADKDYCRANLGSEWKKPFAGTSHSKGIVLEKMCVHWQRQTVCWVGGRRVHGCVLAAGFNPRALGTRGEARFTPPAGPAAQRVTASRSDVC